MTDAAVVRVQGTATTRAMPDQAELRLTVSALAGDRAAALAAAGSRADAVAAVLRDAGVPDTDWRTSGVRVQPEYDWVDGHRTVAGHRAEAQYAVLARHALDALGAVVVDAVGRADADVDGPHWIVSSSNPARLEAYAQAALDARSRASAYAQALGLRLGEVVRIDELTDDAARPQPRMMAAMASGPGPETVHVGDVEVGAAVTVTFALVEGSA
jgi:hypothetical protein